MDLPEAVCLSEQDLTESTDTKGNLVTQLFDLNLTKLPSPMSQQYRDIFRMIMLLCWKVCQQML